MPSLIKSGAQLRGARAMAGLDQEQLAQAAGIAAATVRRLEAMSRIRANSTTLDGLEQALAKAGVEFTDDGKPGVRMREPTAA
jgi:transcriptional regulator with XRE-family HTH domain